MEHQKSQLLHAAQCALILTIMGLDAKAQVSEINFDDVADNTIVDSRYAGVTLVNPLGGSVYARDGGGFAPSSPNVVSIFSASASSVPFFDAYYGAVDAHFSTPQMQVSIDARPVGPIEFLGSLTKRPFLEAYAAGGVFLGRVLYAGPLPTECCWSVGPTERLTFTSSSANIAYVRFSSQYAAGSLRTYAIFDNLRLSPGTQPVISLTATDAVAGEPGTGRGSGTFTFSRTGPVAAPLSVDYTVEGTASMFSDYSGWGKGLTFAAGSATATIVVNVLDDATIEGDETVVLALSSGAGYAVGSPSSATVVIKDDDLPVVTVSATDATAGEPGTGSGSGTFTFSRSGPTTSSLTVNLTVTGTATSGSDYSAIGTAVTFAAGSATRTTTVSVIDDATLETDETVRVTLTSGAGYSVGSPSIATVTIKDDEVASPPGVIVDNAAASGIVFAGTWSASTTTPGYWASNYRHDGNTAKGSKTATFTPNLPSAGMYQVLIWHPSRSDYAANVPVDIVHAGVTTTVIVDQRQNGGRWKLLGTFSFSAGTGGYVRIRTTGTTGYVVADAVRFVPVTEVIVDNAAASGVTYVGTWSASTTTAGYWASNYRHDGNTSKGTKSATFAPNLPTAGSYQVFMWYPARSDYASSVPVDILHAGVTTTVQVNQRLNGRQWNLLGTFNFNAGTGGYARIRTTGTAGYVAADAFKWVSVPAPSPILASKSEVSAGSTHPVSIEQDREGNVVLQWSTAPGVNYTLQTTGELAGEWEVLFEAEGDGSTQSFTVKPDAPSASFRVMRSTEN